ncbi:MAG: hypothetical protein AAF561_15925 [Planctomycetota bacterium]
MTLRPLLGFDKSVLLTAIIVLSLALIVFSVALPVGEKRLKRIMEEIGDRRACTFCGYDLTDRPNADCPECGRKAIESGFS